MASIKEPLVWVGSGKKLAKQRDERVGELDVAKSRPGSLEFHIGPLVWSTAI